MLLNPNRHEAVGSFSVAEYCWEIEHFSTSKNVGVIENSNVATEKAKELWSEKFSLSDNIATEVAWDSENECWHINSLPPMNTLGGIYHVIIRENGDVIALWLDD